VKVPPDQRLAIRSVVKSEGQPSNGSPKPDGIKGVGSVLSPEKCIVVVRKDNPEIQDKADVLDLTEGSSPLHEMASAGVTTGVLDQGMWLTGVARELGVFAYLGDPNVSLYNNAA